MSTTNLVPIIYFSSPLYISDPSTSKSGRNKPRLTYLKILTKINFRKIDMKKRNIKINNEIPDDICKNVKVSDES